MVENVTAPRHLEVDLDECSPAHEATGVEEPRGELLVDPRLSEPRLDDALVVEPARRLVVFLVLLAERAPPPQRRIAAMETRRSRADRCHDDEQKRISYP